MSVTSQDLHQKDNGAEKDALSPGKNGGSGKTGESDNEETIMENQDANAAGEKPAGPGADPPTTSTPMLNNPSLRKSSRTNKGNPPQWYGTAAFLGRGRGGRGRGGRNSRTKAGEGARSMDRPAERNSADQVNSKLATLSLQNEFVGLETDSVGSKASRGMSYGSHSGYTENSVASTIARKRRQLLQAEEMDRLEEEAERKRLERKKAIYEMRNELAELEEADLEEENDQKSGKSVQSIRSKILAWDVKRSECDENEQQLRRQDRDRRTQRSTCQLQNTPEVKGFEKYLARQAMCKDLPIFSGEVREWPLFFSTYKKSTEACGFLPNENINRLQKCLKGQALETVRALLMTDRESEVIETLERRFGRPEYVIKDLMRNLISFAEIKENRLHALLPFSDAVSNFVATVEALEKPAYLNNVILKEQLVAKLPISQKMQWATESEHTIDLNIVAFAQWLRKQGNILCKIYDPNVEKQHLNVKKSAVIGAVTDKNQSTETLKCIFCDGEHHVSKCEKIKNECVDDRWTWAKNKKLCFSCLKPVHSIKECRRKRCNKNGCLKRHHFLLHNDNYKPAEVQNVQQEEKDQEIAHVAVIQRRKRHVFMRVLPVTLNGPAGEIDTYAYLDPGSSVSIIQADLAKELGLKGKIAPLHAEWTNGATLSEPVSRQVTMTIRGSSDREYTLTDVQTQQNLKLPRSTVRIDTDKWKHLQGLPLSDILYAQPRILIGEDHAELIVARKTVSGSGNSPLASLTALGWVVHGKCQIEKTDSDCVMFYHQKEEDQISEQLKEFWNTKAFGVKPTSNQLRSKEDQRAEEIMEKTARRVDGRWEVGLLWKTDNEILPPSKKMAEQRFVALERKRDRDLNFSREYEEKMKDYEKKGYAVRLNKAEAMQHDGKTWYLPHFPVFNPNKPGKMRIVFDAAAKSHGVSLNDRLLKGPDLLGSLVGVLCRFRERPIAIGGDLKEMFHQIRIRKEDRRSQRILQRDETTRELIVLEMQVMIFRAVSSPYVAQEIRNRNAKDFEKDFPKAYQAIIEKHYMDDYYDSLDTIPEAVQRAKEVAMIHQRGGFEIRNWMSNSQEVLQTLPEEALSKGSSRLAFVSENYQRVLGVIWLPKSDVFTFTTEFPKILREIVCGTKQPTKREVLRMIMSLFDPLGLVSLLSVRAKILMQDLWRSGCDWDQQLPDNLQDKWQNWLQLLADAANLQIPRSYVLSIGKVKEIQLHVFCDASQQAFSAAAYFRLEGITGIRTTLVMSKSKVAPLKPMTIPRMELQAAVMGSRLMNFIGSEHRLEITKKYLWTDSQTVLRWIRSDARKYQTFVAHRIGEILESTAQHEWRWVPTKENVADDATRDTQPLNLQSAHRWFSGPEFLSKDESEWPQDVLSGIINEEKMELKREFLGAVTNEKNIIGFLNFSRFAKWQRLIRTVAWVLVAVKKWRSWKRGQEKQNIAEMILPVSEVQQAQLEVLKIAQMESFPEDRHRLKEGREVASSSRLFQLSPMIDANGIIRMDGRIRASSALSQATRQPVILDGKHPVVRLLIFYFHHQAGHHGRERVLNDLKQEYWIIKARAAVKSVWNACQECKNRKAQPRIPTMAQLPAVRTDGSGHPFKNVGVDYFGPFDVTVGRRREKRYGVLFTCLSFRAVHLEIAYSLSADSTIMALRRMINRRWKPQLIMSDNGTNFVGGERELREAIAEMDGEELQRRASSENIEWKFISPLSPHMGGSWERLVKTVKRALEAVMREQAPKDEVLQTLFSEAEYSVNSRPLTYVSDDPSDVQCLTPMQFLRIAPGAITENHGAPGIFDERDCILRKQWRKAQYFADQFWKRWVREYLPTINKRTKWYRGRENLAVGDVVVIADSRVPRNQWTKGRITEVYPGDDGRIRIADVKTAVGTYRRPATKLCVLEVHGCNTGGPELQEGVCCGR